MTVREQLRAAYLASGKSHAEIAALAGVSEGTVMNIFRGRNVTMDTLCAVATVLKIEAIQLPQRIA